MQALSQYLRGCGGVSDPCLICPLPDCDEASVACAYRQGERARKRIGNSDRVRRYQQHNRLGYLLTQIESQRERRIERALRAVRAA